MARKIACDILYQLEIRGDDLEQVLKDFQPMIRDGVEELELPPGGIPEFSLELVRTYLSHQEEIDGLIEGYSEGWTLPRMPMVDRNLLRLGFTELLYFPDIPVSVTINEYLELAKAFSTGDSGRFINGVMASLVKDRGIAKGEAGEPLPGQDDGGQGYDGSLGNGYGEDAGMIGPTGKEEPGEGVEEDK